MSGNSNRPLHGDPLGGDHEAVLAWARCVFWAEVEAEQYSTFVPASDEPTTGHSFVLMLQWYAALWVAIEAWRGVDLSDPFVDDLLDAEEFQQCAVSLRRLRNGVYHYQKSLIDDRLLGFLQRAPFCVYWAFLVQSEFKRVLWRVAHPDGVPEALRHECAESVRDVVGWLPDRDPDAAPDIAKRRYTQILDMVHRTGGGHTDEGRNLIAAAENFLSTATWTASTWAQQKRAWVNALKVMARTGDSGT